MTIKSPEELSILLVVPSPVQGRILLHELGGQGIADVASCKNIEEALQQMHEYQPNLVISSMYFEDGDGIDLVTAMRTNQALEHILFMLISSEDRFEMLDPIRQAGVVAILPKPFTRKALVQAINTSMGFLSAAQLVNPDKDVSQLKILLVDDSKLARRHMLKVLENVGVDLKQVVEAENGSDAIEKLMDDNFDLVLTDYNMPQMDGEELLKFIRQHDELDGLPVIMVTSEQNQTKLASVRSHGVTAMVDKPFEPVHVRELLEAQL